MPNFDMLRVKDRCVVFNGNCLEVLPTLPSNAVHATITDIPYGTTACKWDTIIPFDPMWQQLTRIVPASGAIALFGSEPFSSVLRTSTYHDALGNVRNALTMFNYDWIWDKVRPSGFQIAKYTPMKRHELISVFSRNTLTWYPVKKLRTKPVKGRVTTQSASNPIKYNDGLTRTYNDKNPQSILRYSKQSDGKYLHPTQKPVALLEYLIKTYTQPNDIVLDFTMGAASTGVAALRTGRRFIGIELDDHYFGVAVNRLRSELRG